MMRRLFIQLLFALTLLFALLPISSQACLVCCGRHVAASFLRPSLPPPSSSTILFDTNAAALNHPSWQESCNTSEKQQQLLYIPRAISGARHLDEATIIINMDSLSKNTDWKHILAGKDLFLLSNLEEKDKKDNNIDDGDSTPPRLLQKNEEGAKKVEGESNKDNDGDENMEQSEEKTQQQPVTMTTAMVASIGFYKRFISPLLPPACRFFPTCSQYGVQAIQEFGPCQGGILTAWRLLRCSPLGGKGYDPPKWPPVPYTYSSY